MSWRRISVAIQLRWDACARHLARHPRKYQAAAFLFVFLPQWAPTAWSTTKWIWAFLPASPSDSLATALNMTPPFSWSLVTAPIGLAFMALVWWETRKHVTDGPSEKNLAKDLIGALIAKGEDEHRKDDKASAEAWATLTRDFILDIYGDGESALFKSDAGFTVYSGGSQLKTWIALRLTRLNNLVARCDGLALRNDPRKWKDRIKP